MSLSLAADCRPYLRSKLEQDVERAVQERDAANSKVTHLQQCLKLRDEETASMKQDHAAKQGKLQARVEAITRQMAELQGQVRAPREEQEPLTP